ncbi:MAG: DUF3604 domain-containing protein [Alphaproteobacteria bacterium]|nr:DUF3604 domain-containing protein [Alphaproteobacteria bacterium]
MRLSPALLLLLPACRDKAAATDSAAPADDALVHTTEDRTPCAERTAARDVFWGDLHVHAAMSFDAANYGSTLTPAQVFGFAQGASVVLPGDRTVSMDRPLDFMSLTEHGDFLGEVAHCTTPGALGYDADICSAYQGGDPDSALDFGVLLASEDPTRLPELCGEDGAQCDAAATERWQALQDAAEAAYDRSADCSFTPLIGYEYTNTRGVSNLHRNIIFRNHRVPDRPITTFEAPTPLALWQQLSAACPGGDDACDVLSLPHNSNLSNGHLFYPDYEDGDSAEVAALRHRMEPVVEIMQHKGESECRTDLGLSDERCGFEKLRPADDPICDDDETGTGGMRLWGCVHRLDFARNVLAEGLSEAARLGVNPYRLGVIGSTDTHNGTPGLVRSVDFPGHVGIVDDTPEERLGDGVVTHDTLINNPGGLAAVWAVENSRDAIFEAIRRRETYATSGPRIRLRTFAGRGLSDDFCSRADLGAGEGEEGVPMGGVISGGDGPLRIAVEALADEGTVLYPGVGLERVQVIKVWRSADGSLHDAVYDVATGDPGSLDPATCDASGGADRLCTVWEDPDFDPDVPALWYTRVLEVPTCRWSTRECLALDETDRPAVCSDGSVPATVQQRAWSSPVWWDG